MLKTLAKIPKKWGLYRPKPETNRWLKSDSQTAGGRPPTVINMTVGASRSTGPVDRPKTESKALWPVDRSGRPCPVPGQRAQVCARLARQWAGRPVGRPDKRALLSVSGRSTGSPNGHIYDHWRSTERSTASLSG